MQVDGHDIGVCSWSLRPRDLGELAEQVQELGLEHVQLALEPLLFLDDKRIHHELGHLRAAKLNVTAGMIAFPGEDYSTIAMIRKTGGFVPDGEWPLRKQMAVQAAKLARDALGVPRVSTHVGFVPPSSQQGYQVMVARVGEIADAFGALDAQLLMETGQETAPELLQFLNDLRRPNVRVNFDPANMILYGAGDPIAAIRTLGRHIGHVHVKDAKLSTQPGIAWGDEVPVGTGDVDVADFLAALRAVGYTGPLVVEREAGENRLDDVRTAIRTLQSAAG